jgi:hypothetical protein
MRLVTRLPTARLITLLLVSALLPWSLLSQQPEPAPAPPPPPVKRIAQGYFYIEPNQARFECLLDLTTALEWLAIPDLSGEILPASAAKIITTKASALAATWCSARAEGLSVLPNLTLTQLVRGEPGRTLPINPSDSISVAETMLGFMWEIPVAPHPQKLSVTWQGFIDHVKTLPVTLFFGSVSDTQNLATFAPHLRWENSGRLPAPPPLVAVPLVPEQPTIPIRLGAILWCTFGLLYLIFLRKPGRWLPTGTLPFLCVWILGALLTYPLIIIKFPAPGSTQSTGITTATQADAIVSPLLRNIYRAFDNRQESTIYDILARSAEGPLLKQLYLDIISALSLDESEAARVHVAEFSSEVEEVSPGKEDGSFTAKTSWSALGTVGHWGHSHTRTNVNLGRITVSPINGSWRITALEMLDQRRL